MVTSWTAARLHVEHAQRSWSWAMPRSGERQSRGHRQQTGARRASLEALAARRSPGALPGTGEDARAPGRAERDGHGGHGGREDQVPALPSGPKDGSGGEWSPRTLEAEIAMWLVLLLILIVVAALLLRNALRRPDFRRGLRRWL